ncbi:MAG: TlpA family protein disulfide reductase [Candidatus Hydrogenedentes bacterium]|nr:TlpA family protein disulfide reductase [Candidatus Hydrogenedentota bacterium]
MTEPPNPTPPERKPSTWKHVVTVGCVGVVTGAALLLAALLGLYAFYQKEAIHKMAETKELKPVRLLADYGWMLEDAAGEPVDLRALRGRAIFLHLWRPECVSCVAEIPGLNALYNDTQHLDLAFVSVALDPDADLDDAVALHGVEFPVFTGKSAEIPSAFEAHSTPTTYIIAPDGFIVFRHAGAMDWDSPDARGFLESLAQTSEPAPPAQREPAPPAETEAPPEPLEPTQPGRTPIPPAE